MRKVILGVAVSLDGFIEGPHGEYDWCFTDQDYGMKDFFKRIDAIVMGRKTYDVAQKQGGGGASPWKGITTYVFSNTLKEVKGKDTRLLSGDVEKHTRALKQEKGKDIWMFGGAELTTTFIRHSLIDEYWLAVHPILLGSGKPLFQNFDGRKKLKLVSEKGYNTGLISLCYEPA